MPLKSVGVLVVTGEPVARPGAKAGGALWYYDLKMKTTNRTAPWTLIRELAPGAMWVSVDFNRFDLSPALESKFGGVQEPSPTPSVTPAAFQLRMDAVGESNKPACTASVSESTSVAGGGSSSAAAAAVALLADATACASRALPPVKLSLSVRSCPGGSTGTAELVCTSAAPELLEVRPARVNVTCPPRNGTFASLGVNISVAALPEKLDSLTLATLDAQSAVRNFAARCELRKMDGGSLTTATAMAPISWLPYRFPDFEDLILYYSATDTFLSARRGVSAKPAVGGARGAGEIKANMEAALRRFVPTLTNLPPKPAFAATVSQAVRGTLVSKSAARLWAAVATNMSAGGSVPPLGPFTRNTTLTLRTGAVLRVLWASADGTLLHFEVPQARCVSPSAGSSSTSSTSSAGRCEAASGVCGPQDLVLAQPPLARAAAALNITCPPACPGLPDDVTPAVPTGAWPALAAALVRAPTSSGDSSFGPLYVSERQALLAAASSVSVAATCLASSSTGLLFAAACEGYTAPDFEDACTNTSHPAFAGCAFGDGILVPCRACPANAICRGGPSAQPLRGYYAVAETTGDILPCAPPANERCLGWDAENAFTICGSAYLNGSYGCLACREGHFPSKGGGCEPCNGGSPLLQVIAQAAQVFGILVAFATGMFTALLLIARCLGSTLKGGASRFTEMVLFVVMMMQTLAEVGQASAASQPALLAPLYAGIAAFQLQGGVSIHQNCLKGIPPFTDAVLLMMFTIVATVALVCISAWQVRQQAGAAGKASGKSGDSEDAAAAGGWRGKLRKCCQGDRAARRLVYGLCFALSIAYARTVNVVFQMVHCVAQSLPVDMVAGMNGADVELLATADGRGLVPGVLQLQSSTSFICYRGAHRAVGVLAWITAFVYLGGFFIWSFIRSVRFVKAYRLQLPSLKRADTAAAGGGTASGFVAKDAAADFFARTAYRPAIFYFRHFEFVSFLALGAMLVYWHHPASAGAYAAKAVVTCLILTGLAASMLVLKPHYAEDAWRAPVRVGSFVVAGLVAVMNALLGASELPGSPAVAQSALDAMGYVLIIAAVVWVLLLLVFVGRSLVQGAKAEAKVRELQDAIRTASGRLARSGQAPPAKAASAGRKDGSEEGGPRRCGKCRSAAHEAWLWLLGEGKPRAPAVSTRFTRSSSGRQVIAVAATGPREPAGARAKAKRSSSSRALQYAMEQLQQREMLGGAGGSGASQDMLKALAAGYGSGAGSHHDADVVGTALPLALRRDVLARLDAEGGGAGAGPDGFAVHNPLSAKSSAVSMSARAEASGGPGAGRRASLAASLAFAAGGTSGFVEGGSGADGSPARQGRASMHGAGGGGGQHRRASRVSMRVRAGTGPGGDQKVAPGAGDSSFADTVSPLYDPWLMGSDSPAAAAGAAAGGAADPENAAAGGDGTAAAAAAGGAPAPGRRVVRLSQSSPTPASRHRASHAAVSFAGSGSRKGR